MGQLQIIATFAVIVLSLFVLPVNAQLPPSGLDIGPIAIQDQLSSAVGSEQPQTFIPSTGSVQQSQSTASRGIPKTHFGKIDSMALIPENGFIWVHFARDRNAQTFDESSGLFSLFLRNDADLPLHQRMFDLLFYASTNDMPVFIYYDSPTSEILAVGIEFKPTSLDALTSDQNPFNSLTGAQNPEQSIGGRRIGQLV